MVPPVGSSSPHRHLISVVLPEPLRPTMAPGYRAGLRNRSRPKPAPGPDRGTESQAPEVNMAGDGFHWRQARVIRTLLGLLLEDVVEPMEQDDERCSRPMSLRRRRSGWLVSSTRALKEMSPPHRHLVVQYLQRAEPQKQGQRKERDQLDRAVEQHYREIPRYIF